MSGFLARTVSRGVDGAASTGNMLNFSLVFGTPLPDFHNPSVILHKSIFAVNLVILMKSFQMGEKL